MNIVSTTNPATRDECGTPPEILEAARTALGGGLSLDPCSNAVAQMLVQAETYWTADDDCTSQDWLAHTGLHRSLWCNPPCSAAAMRSIVPLIVSHAPAFGVGAITLANAVSSRDSVSNVVSYFDHLCAPAVPLVSLFRSSGFRCEDCK